MTRIVISLCLLLSLSVLPAAAQTQNDFDATDPESLDDIAQALQFLSQEYADLYVQPLSDAFGSGMNAGLFRSASSEGGLIPKLDLYVGAYVSGALMANSQRTFAPPTPTTIESNGQTFIVEVRGIDEVPSVFGDRVSPDEGRIAILDENGNPLRNAQGQEILNNIRIPPGLVDTPVAPLVMPQIGIGTVFGTSVQFRYLPETRIQEYGTIGLFGVAVRHSLDQYIPAFPLDLAVQGAYNRMSLSNNSPITSSTAAVDDVLDMAGWAVNVQASKNIPVLPIIFYGGLQYEKFNVDYNYVFDPSGGDTVGGEPVFDPIEVNISQTAQNRVRGVIGTTITLALVRLNVDYALSNNDAVTVGLGVQL